MLKYPQVWIHSKRFVFHHFNCDGLGYRLHVMPQIDLFSQQGFNIIEFFVWIYNGILSYRCEQKAILTLYGWNCRIIYIFEPYFPTFCQKELIPFSATMLPFVTAGIFMAYALFLGVWLWLCILMRQLWGTESGRYNYDKNDFSTFTDLKGNFIDLLIMYTFIFQELS